MRFFSYFLFSGLLAFSVAQRNFFASSEEAQSSEFTASGEDALSSEEIPAASISKIQRSDPEYGSATNINHALNAGGHLYKFTYDFMGKNFTNPFDLSRHLILMAFRKACTEAVDLDENRQQKCYDCIQNFDDVIVHEYTDYEKYELPFMLETCSKRYLKKSKKFATCHRFIDDQYNKHDYVLKPIKDDEYMTMQHISPEAVYLSDKVPLPVLSYSWQFYFSNFYRCVHSQSIQEHKEDCRGDKSCISQLYDQSMTTVVQRPRDAPVTPIEFRVQGYNAELQQAELARHNKLRALHGTPPLVLDDEAQNWANYLAETQQFKHNLEGQAETNYGENLYKHGGDIYRPSIYGSGTQFLYSEIKEHNFDNPVYGSGFNTGDPGVNGHFTQIVWKNTKRVGFGLAHASNGKHSYLVANFDPAGNKFNPTKGTPTDILRENVLPLCAKSPHDGCHVYNA